jgi:hypothetical protein
MAAIAIGRVVQCAVAGGVKASRRPSGFSSWMWRAKKVLRCLTGVEPQASTNGNVDVA